MGTLNAMEQEGRAMLADSRDYHTLEGVFLLVRDGHAVWLCRQGESAALDDCERLLCVASEVPTPGETVPRYVVDGAESLDDPDGPLFQGDGAYPPFVIFDTAMQWNLPTHYPTREAANAALARLGDDPAGELERLHLALRAAHEGETDDDSDFDAWLAEVADNLLSIPKYRDMATRYLELEKFLDVQ